MAEMNKIMFNDSFGLTKAVIAETKTITRRIAYDFRKHTSHMVFRSELLPSGNITYMDGKQQVIYELPKPHYKVGEVVAVAQSYKDLLGEEYLPPSIENEIIALVEADSKGISNKMFVRADLMAHYIKMINYRVERLQDISDEDCMKEGVIHYDDVFGECYMLAETYNNNYRRHCFTTPRKAFAYLIDKLSGKGTWDSNPYVHVYEFQKT